MNIAVIPARGGSKRLPRKNIREFAGKPMIAWSIEAAISSQCFQHIIVSTDDDEIASIAQKYGAEVPFVRPKSLSDDFTGTNAVVEHAVRWFVDAGYTVDHVCCIYPTAPLVCEEDIRRGLVMLTQYCSDFVFPVSSFPYPVQRALSLDNIGYVSPVNKEFVGSRSQDLAPAWHDAGQFYWGSKDAWISGSDIFMAKSIGMCIPRFRVVDIDTQEDWDCAERMRFVLDLPISP